MAHFQTIVPGIGIKWPNDLLLDDIKVGGCLVEVQGDASGLGIDEHQFADDMRLLLIGHLDPPGEARIAVAGSKHLGVDNPQRRERPHRVLEGDRLDGIGVGVVQIARAIAPARIPKPGDERDERLVAPPVDERRAG